MVTSVTAATGAGAAWTVLIYMAADNHLSDGNPSQVTTALGQMLAAQSSPAVNVIVGLIGKGATETRFAIQNGVSTQVGASIPSVDTGKPGPLTDFIDWGIATYPATNISVIVWSDGNGVADWGAESDAIVKSSQPHSVFGYNATGFSNTFKSYLTTKALASALSSTQYCQGGGKYALLAFDACLMGMMEICYEVGSSSRNVVACEQVFFGGLQYTSVLSDLVANPGWSGSDLALDMVTQQLGSASTPASTLVAVDLGQLPAFATGFKQLVTVMAANSAAVAAARASTTNIFEAGLFVDLPAFLAQLPESQAATNVANLLRNAILSASIAGSGSLSFFYPYLGPTSSVILMKGASTKSNLSIYQSLQFPTDTGWGALLATLL